MKRLARRLSPLAIAGLLIVGLPGVVLANPDSGTKNCGNFIGYVHSRYNDGVSHQGPGGSMGYTFYYDYQWHTSERNGNYSGFWSSTGAIDLDMANTWAGCRNFG